MKITALIPVLAFLSLSLPTVALAEGQRITFPSYDGTKLSGLLYKAENPKALLLVVPGIQSHSDWYRSGDKYAAAGITSLVFDRRGVGRSEGVRGDAKSTDQILKDLAIARKRLLQEDPSGLLPIHALANSLGYYLTIPFAHDQEDAFASIILTTPAAAVTKETDFSTAEQAKILVSPPKKYFKLKLKPEYFADPGPWLDYVTNDPLATRQVTARFLRSVLPLKLQAKRNAKELDIPMLLLLATKDQITDNATTKAEFYANYPGPKELYEFESKHFLDFGPAAPEVGKTVIRWILSH